MAELTPLLAFRWSPRAFDPDAELTGDEAASLLEAARWAPSAGNAQPWRFALGHRQDETWKRILVTLPEPDQGWARHASALVVGAHTGAPSTAADYGSAERAAYDLGQAVAHLTVQATALGLHVRQLTRFDRGRLGTELDLPAGVRPLVVAAVGRLGDPAALPADLHTRETALRHRHPLAALLIP
ncbi:MULTISPECIES: nitroreductase family protein [Micromonospora]|uniref:Nitroreductase n=1 Tax=Micromonospora solifontis TaxID=2487138 RepID=A0ABX9WB55_9ACTN|nr:MULTISPECIES: nitroreductase family protein [Micromonospora]NES16481.1 nitroreductase [Micromonospora sp. PPF5-17B]NES38716.1 nitroreductase [Micromonospora solifontis]NES58169.1 nitroreductase [Micromonospora sp. PPF5-6]RNL93950.1 nitroreductase [Micromonospora solifontis]